MPDSLSDLRRAIDAATYADPEETLAALTSSAGLSRDDRARIAGAGASLVTRIREDADPGLMEVFLAEYGLSTDEGVALMCLAEALLRVPDADTIDALIEDKIAPSDWGRHLGHSTSSLVNASTWALMLTGRVLDDDQPGPIGHLRGAIKRLGEPVIRTAVSRAMREMGRQFVLGEDIAAAMQRAKGMEAKGFTYSYDMLGEAARTEADAKRYHLSYSRAIAAIAAAATHGDIRRNPGISVKLSALYPRYEPAQHGAVMTLVVPRLRSLALLAKSAGIGLNVDAEEANRLSLSLDVIEAVLRDPSLAGWDGFGVVVQAYGPRAGAVIDWLHALATELDRKLMVRLVKGAYWDTEIKAAQVEGLPRFPVFTAKPATDVSYISNARKLLGLTDRLYPQFATHNAHTVAAILDAGADPQTYEFQRLHGMGEALHRLVMADAGTRCRIYAPVGAHRDLLAYLVRRLLENGANSSFVNQIVDASVPPEDVARDPWDALDDAQPRITPGTDLYLPERPNSRGWDLDHPPTLDALDTARDAFRQTEWHARPSTREDALSGEQRLTVADPTGGSPVGTVVEATAADVDAAFAAARPWDAPDRAAILNRAADLYEAHHAELFALLAREAGKTLPDCVAELREAVDFLRYYAARVPEAPPLGRVACISPWNFPLAIFTGQIAAALAAGNAVLAKPAPQTPLVAHRAVELLHEAGIPRDALHLLPGGTDPGVALTRDARLDGVAFTGSTGTAQAIRRSLAAANPNAMMIAETGGLNAMIVDSTALPEQAVQAIIESAFQSAGQRCSALRCLYVQSDIAPDLIAMLTGAMDALRLGDPWDRATDVGPVIDPDAQARIAAHIDRARAEGRVRHSVPTPQEGTFIAPTLIEVSGIDALEEEVFGPVLHVATFEADEIDAVIDAINASGYGLTFGLHTRIDDRVQHVTDRVAAGNIYVNRNQIGAIVGSQPFGGEGLSGTGPKAGGPHYVPRFTRSDPPVPGTPWDGRMETEALRAALAGATGGTAAPPASLPGPTGESNRLSTLPRQPLLCLGPGAEAAQAQADAIHRLGGVAVAATGAVDPAVLESLEPLGGVLWWGDAQDGREMAAALARRPGPIVPLITGAPDAAHALLERHVCIDTTAAGGNAALLAQAS
ncbi:bifunctional proline dehydrogenase/L-glutamate gamma-semialdehyde dehydrogenase PutA [Pseudaestuariivita atlantica]|uniref:bifunctional proline dehydrogenase/L-glutamate gamma-semialdehyde dehydrogenase PutA n=1 Tax=Pseudaestuariivita atlantica TaxID=1317121 RepID=UPI000AA78F32|nr:bifunctional proline dehydrogenase/L-glutamate gamma-semialdehyde dehydrogenase PutA [Pseudaestuariivita atlantica]